PTFWPRKMKTKVVRTKSVAHRAVAAVNPQSHKLPRALSDGVGVALADWEAGAKSARVWGLDAKLWTGKDEAQWLGWLNIAAQQLNSLSRFNRLAQFVRQSRCAHALVIGM